MEIRQEPSRAFSHLENTERREITKRYDLPINGKIVRTILGSRNYLLVFRSIAVENFD